jgi:hypothetical protein
MQSRSIWRSGLADVTKGSGRFNLAQGAVGTLSGIGAALSTSIFGFAVEEFGQTAGFLGVAAVALTSVAILWAFMPETKPPQAPQPLARSGGPSPAAHASAEGASTLANRQESRRDVAALDQPRVALGNREGGHFAVAPEANIELVLADAEILNGYVRQPAR